MSEVTPGGLYFQWEEVIDDSNRPLIYSIVGITHPTEDTQVKYLMDVTKENHQYKSSISRRQLSEDGIEGISVKLIVMDPSGNAVSSELRIDPSNPEECFAYEFPGQRISGTDRYQTSVALSQEAFPKGSRYAILVTGEDFPDALSAAPLAKKYNAPILLTPSKTLDPAIEAEINRLGVNTIIIIGGSSAVSQDIEHSLIAEGISIQRIEGATRYATSLAIAKELGSLSEFFLCTGENFPDALSVAAVAASKGLPILLTPTHGLPEGLLEYTETLNLTQIYVVGGSGVISNHVFRQLPKAKRLAGSDRYETNLAILEEFSSCLSSDMAYLATGSNYPDALSGSVLAAQMNSPILLVGTSGTHQARSYLASKGLTDQKVKILGGSGIITVNLLKTIFN